MKIAIIPARGGSRRVPRKNVRPFFGAPMILYPLCAAKASGLFDLIVVSTDDAEIAVVAFVAGATVLPREKDDGTTGTQEIAARVLEQLDVRQGQACVIYPCSPLLLPKDLHGGWRTMQSGVQPAPFVVSTGPDHQDAGCFYWGRVWSFRERVSLDQAAHYVMPAERVCDINTPEDWARAERLYGVAIETEYLTLMDVHFSSMEIVHRMRKP